MISRFMASGAVRNIYTLRIYPEITKELKVSGNHNSGLGIMGTEKKRNVDILK